MDSLKYLGVLCFLYYIMIWGYTKRRTTTFAGFWIVLGLISVTGGFSLDYLSADVVLIISYIIGAVGCIFIVILIIILSGMISVSPQGLSYIIILGAQVRGTHVTSSLERRLKKALEYLNSNQDTKVVVSGGQGKGEDIAESAAMKQYLIEQGVHKNRIIEENKSTTTRENLIYSKKYIGSSTKSIGIVTNNFHIYRAVMTAKSVGYTNPVGIPASSNHVLFINYIVREVFAVIYLFLKRNNVDK